MGLSAINVLSRFTTPLRVTGLSLCLVALGGCVTSAWVEIPAKPGTGARYDPNTNNVVEVMSAAVSAVMRRSADLPAELTLVLPDGATVQTYARVASVDERLTPWAKPLPQPTLQPQARNSAQPQARSESEPMAGLGGPRVFVFASASDTEAMADVPETDYEAARPLVPEAPRPVGANEPMRLDGPIAPPAGVDADDSTDDATMEEADAEPRSGEAMNDDAGHDALPPESSSATETSGDVAVGASSSNQAVQRPWPPKGPMLRVQSVRVRPQRAEVDIQRPGLGGVRQLVTVYLAYRLPGGWHTTKMHAWRAGADMIADQP